jgi:hypothetical protein
MTPLASRDCVNHPVLPPRTSFIHHNLSIISNVSTTSLTSSSATAIKLGIPCLTTSSTASKEQQILKMSLQDRAQNHISLIDKEVSFPSPSSLLSLPQNDPLGSSVPSLIVLFILTRYEHDDLDLLLTGMFSSFPSILL